MIRLQSSRAGNDGDLATLQEARQPLEQFVHDRVLPVLADQELEARLRNLDAEFAGGKDGAVDGGGLEELLGRDAPPVEARAADLVPLDDGDGQPGGGPVECGCIPTWTTTYDDDVELVLSAHRRPFFLSVCRAAGPSPKLPRARRQTHDSTRSVCRMPAYRSCP